MRKQQETGLVCMVGHTRRFNPSHQYVHNKIVAGEFSVLQMDVQTYFFRRKNMNAKGEPRMDRPLLWHHAAHTIDMLAYQAGRIVTANAIQGPKHPDLGHRDGNVDPAQERDGAICTLSLSFNKRRRSAPSSLSATPRLTSRAMTTSSPARRAVDCRAGGLDNASSCRTASS